MRLQLVVPEPMDAGEAHRRWVEAVEAKGMTPELDREPLEIKRYVMVSGRVRS